MKEPLDIKLTDADIFPEQEKQVHPHNLETEIEEMAIFYPYKGGTG